MPRSIKNKSAKPVGKKGTRKGAKNKRPKSPKTPKQKTPKTPKKAKKAKMPKTPLSTPRIEIKEVVRTVEDNSPPTLAYGHIYSKDCGYCKQMQPDWDRVVSSHKHIPLHDIHVVMSNPNDPFQQTIDDFNRRYSLQNAETMLKNQGFPTIFRIRKSNPHDVDYFQNDRTYDSIAQWLSRP
jgi:thiol-disulfide isomerase/thioredoxin